VQVTTFSVVRYTQKIKTVKEEEEEQMKIEREKDVRHMGNG
jgi:hypothetical protein